MWKKRRAYDGWKPRGQRSHLSLSSNQHQLQRHRMVENKANFMRQQRLAEKRRGEIKQRISEIGLVMKRLRRESDVLKTELNRMDNNHGNVGWQRQAA